MINASSADYAGFTVQMLLMILTKKDFRYAIQRHAKDVCFALRFARLNASKLNKKEVNCIKND